MSLIMLCVIMPRICVLILCGFPVSIHRYGKPAKIRKKLSQKLQTEMQRLRKSARCLIQAVIFQRLSEKRKARSWKALRGLLLITPLLTKPAAATLTDFQICILRCLILFSTIQPLFSTVHGQKLRIITRQAQRLYIQTLLLIIILQKNTEQAFLQRFLRMCFQSSGLIFQNQLFTKIPLTKILSLILVFITVIRIFQFRFQTILRALLKTV